MITINNKIYDGIMIKPELDEALEHYGIKGMKWRKHKASSKDSVSTISRSLMNPSAQIALGTYDLIKRITGKKPPKFKRKKKEYHAPSELYSISSTPEENKVKRKKKNIDRKIK